MGIIFKKADIIHFSNIVNSRSEIGVVKQIALAFCFLGHSYRINNTISMFELYPETVEYIKGAKYICLKSLNLSSRDSLKTRLMHIIRLMVA